MEHTLGVDTHSQENRKQILTQRLFTVSPHHLTKRQLVPYLLMSRRKLPRRAAGRVVKRQKVRGLAQAATWARPPSRGGRPGKGLAHRGVTIEAEPSQVAFSLFLCVFQSTWAFTARPCFCSVSFLVLSFKADLKRTDAVQRVPDRRVCLSNPRWAPRLGCLV